MTNHFVFICLFSLTFISVESFAALPPTEPPVPAQTSSPILFAYMSPLALSGAPSGASSGTGNGLGVSALLNGGQLQAAAGSEFVKLVVVLRQGLQVGRVSIEACNGEFKDGANFYFDPGLRYGYSEGGKKTISHAPTRDERGVRAFTINFRHNVAPCIKNLVVTDKEGKPVFLSSPKYVAATISGSLKSVERLFDSQSETSVDVSMPAPPPMKEKQKTKSLPNSKSSSVVVTFAEPQAIDKILFWNGDQSSTRAFESFSRLGQMTIAGENDKTELLALKSSAGLQEIRLQNPLRGNRLTLRPLDSGAISEIEFGNGGDVIVPVQAVNPEVANAFSSSGIENVLDHELSTHDEKDNWLFRFRADGTFFIYGFDESSRSASKFSGLGTFQILSAEKNKIKLNLSGNRRVTAAAWDGYACELACSEPEARDISRVMDLLIIEKHGSTYMVRNRTALKKRTLPFSDMRTKISTLVE